LCWPGEAWLGLQGEVPIDQFADSPAGFAHEPSPPVPTLAHSLEAASKSEEPAHTRNKETRNDSLNPQQNPSRPSAIGDAADSKKSLDNGGDGQTLPALQQNRKRLNRRTKQSQPDQMELQDQQKEPKKTVKISRATYKYLAKIENPVRLANFNTF
jgi:hypothetical protein